MYINCFIWTLSIQLRSQTYDKGASFTSSSHSKYNIWNKFFSFLHWQVLRSPSLMHSFTYLTSADWECRRTPSRQMWYQISTASWNSFQKHPQNFNYICSYTFETRCEIKPLEFKCFISSFVPLKFACEIKEFKLSRN